MPKFIFFTLFAALTLFIVSSAGDISHISKDDPPSDKPLKVTQGRQPNQGHGGSIIKTFGDLILHSEGDEKPLRGEEKDQINFLFLGIGGEEHVSGNYLTDTIILAVFTPSSKKAAVISIPRDLLVRSSKAGYFTKINALYAIDIAGKGFPGPMGIELMREAIRQITNISIDYYAVLNLKGIEKIVDTIGGIYVRPDQDLTDKFFPDDKFGYETYKISEGWRYLNGEETAKYIRTRNTAGGDFDRMKRQQEVMRAIKKKAEGLKSVSSLPKLLSVYRTLNTHLSTDLELKDITRLMQLAENVKEEDIIFERITAEINGLLLYARIELGGTPTSALKPRAGLENYEEIKEKIKEIIKELQNAK